VIIFIKIIKINILKKLKIFKIINMTEESRNTFSKSNYTMITALESRPSTKKNKILILGAPGVGKSAMIMRFKDDIFLDYYDPTIQTTYRKTLQFNNENVELELVDLDGQSEYTLLSFPKFSYGVHGYILSYSIESRQSFELLKIINSKLMALVGRDVPKILVANKSDLLNKREISPEEGKNFATQINCPYIECSAKSNANINKMFHTLLVVIKQNENNVDFKGLSCRSLFEFFVKNEKVLIKVFYGFTGFDVVKNNSINIDFGDFIFNLWVLPRD
jgi:Ras family protein